MCEKLIFENKELIKMWAKTTFFKDEGNIFIIKHYQTGMYYYFSRDDSKKPFHLKMTSLEAPK